MMRWRRAMRGMLLCAAASGLPAGAQVVPAAAPGEARVIVQFKATAKLLAATTAPVAEQPALRARELGKRLGLAMTSGSAVSPSMQVVRASGLTSEALAARLAQDEDVEFAVPDARRRIATAPDDPLYADGVPGNGPAVGQWYLRAPSGGVQSSINIEPAWAVTPGDSALVVAVVDTGVRFDHPDLLSVAAGGKLLPGYDMISDARLANDGDGRDADASDPGDWVTAAEANDASGPFYQCTRLDPDTGKYGADNSSWHGTQVAGVVAALTDNATGMAGVGRGLRVLPVRALGKCGGFDSDIVAAMRWAAGLPVPGTPANPTPARVINLSLGGTGICNAAYANAIGAIAATGAVVVAAAGNTEGEGVSVPGNCSGVIAVAGLRHVGTKVGFSSLGPEVAISAPGGNCVNTTPGSPCLYPILTTSNAGVTTPGSAIYTDSLKPSLGTSFASPLAAGTVGLLLSVQPSLTAQQVKLVLQSTSRPFPATSDTPGVPACKPPQVDATGNPVPQDECLCSIDTCGAGIMDAGAAVVAAANGTAPTSVQAQGLWWDAPAGSESGWGINLAHQGASIFATWFTYDATGKAWWLSMSAGRIGPSADLYSGQILATRGPPFNAAPFDPALVTRNVVGSGTLSFGDLNHASFSYTLNGVQQTKSLTRQVFGPLPTCTYGVRDDFRPVTNFQDLWWVANGAESGWGLNVAQQGQTIFATWFTYDVDGAPLWLSMTAAASAPSTFSGALIRTRGPAFSAVPFDPALVTRTVVGAATLTFHGGFDGTFAYTVNGVAGQKAITRQLFAPPAATVCD